MTREAYTILSARFGRKDGHLLRTYEAEGGYQALRQVLGSMQAGQVVETVKESGLRGRGGAGFPTGVKWGFVPKDADQVYFFVNADESEPGTFKDRYLMDYDPHQTIEGTIISCFAVRANLAFIYIRGEFGWLIDRVQEAVDEAYAAGYLGKNILGSGYDLDMIVHKGAGAYICGEETGLINSVTGTKGQPSIKPPFPAVSGFLGKPTIVNNVETVAAVPWIITNGAAAYKKIGTEKSAGTKLWSVSGPVKNQGVFEVPLGLPFSEFFRDYLGGMRDGEEFKACIVGGSSVPVLTAEEMMACNLDYESLQTAGTMLGSGGMIIIPKSSSMVELHQGAHALLLGRELRPVHAVPRGHGLVAPSGGAHPQGRGRARGSGPAREGVRRHDWPDDLPAFGCGGHAHAQLPATIPWRVRGTDSRDRQGRLAQPLGAWRVRGTEAWPS